MLRKIVEINEELCNGCGACANACHEDAIVMVNGKAKLIKDDYCDGLGDCLPGCPVGAITIVEREAAEYDEAAVKQRQQEKVAKQGDNCATVSHGCPGMAARAIQHHAPVSSIDTATETAAPTTGFSNFPPAESRLAQWPVQIKLMPLLAPYYENANLLIAADCTAYAYARFHEDYMKNHVTIIGCPKLDEGDYTEKLCEIIKGNNIKSVKILRMEVPCCGGLEHAAIEAMRQSGKMLPWQVVTVNIDGTIREE